MTYNEKLTARVREALSGVRRVEEKRMFRGAVFMVNGKMCVTAGDDRIMCRIDPALHDVALGRKGTTTVVMRGRDSRGWVYVDGEGMKTKKQLEYWVGLALDFNRKAKASKKKAKT
jgi:TfoX/Sxy family transcriptional regulator of competence genes